jgi:predicted transcriptional regulator
VLLARARVERPGLRASSDPQAVARAIGFTVEIDPTLPNGVDGWIDRESSTIVVARRDTPSRQAFSVAHELMHAVAPANVPSEHLEAYCDRGAAALMLPAHEFLESGTACAWDLDTLRAWWPHASCSAIMRRAVELLPGSASSIWEAAAASLRRSYGVELPEHLDALEEFVACEAMQTGRSSVRAGGVLVQAWRTGDRFAVTLARKVG